MNRKEFLQQLGFSGVVLLFNLPTLRLTASSQMTKLSSEGVVVGTPLREEDR